VLDVNDAGFYVVIDAKRKKANKNLCYYNKRRWW
jgi:hypothetical protein